jgi:hypothetical protein
MQSCKIGIAEKTWLSIDKIITTRYVIGMNALKIKKKTKPGKSGESTQQISLDGSSYSKGVSPTSGGPLSSFYSAGPVLSLKGLIQPKLTIGQPNDRYEQEADRVADQVMRIPEPKGSLGNGHLSLVPRKAGCSECTEETVQTKPLGGQIIPLIQREAATDSPTSPASPPSCIPARGIPNTNCSIYWANSWWLPFAYVNNATCACTATPNVPTANCVRKFLQDRLAATPTWLKAMAYSQKPIELTNPPLYQLFVQTMLTPRIYRDHVDAYRSCCCPSGPAPYPSWIGVTTVPIPSCYLVGASIRYFGSCHGTPGRW